MFTPKLLRAPSPEKSAKRKSPDGHMITPVSSCGIPRKKYAFAKSNPTVNFTFPGFGSVEPWACAGDAVAATSRPMARHTLIPRIALPLRRMRRLPKRLGSVREADSERTDHLVAFTTVEEFCCRAELLVFYAAVHVP